MKTIEFFYTSKKPIIIDDDDDQDLKIYTKELAEILNKNNVTILETTSKNIILRPNLILAISVTEKDSISHPIEEEKQIDISDEKQIDIITL